VPLESDLEPDPSTLGPGAALVGIGALGLVAGSLLNAIGSVAVRARLPAHRYRGPSILVMMVLVLALATPVQIVFLADAVAIFGGSGEPSTAGSFAVLSAQQAAMLVISGLFVFGPGALVGERLFVWASAVRSVARGLLTGLPVWLLATLLALVVALVLSRFGIDPQAEAAQAAIGRVDPWVVLVTFVGIAPVAEEIFFRGVVYRAWAREYGPHWSLWGSALLFALIHISAFDLSALAIVIPILPVGLALAALYRRTGSLIAPIVLHATFNALSVAVVLLLPPEFVPTAMLTLLWR
jgi:membrane protease YdiL (CAAX protease family)